MFCVMSAITAWKSGQWSCWRRRRTKHGTDPVKKIDAWKSGQWSCWRRRRTKHGTGPAKKYVSCRGRAGAEGRGQGRRGAEGGERGRGGGGQARAGERAGGRAGEQADTTTLQKYAR
jgi:hypothetical protein